MDEYKFTILSIQSQNQYCTIIIMFYGAKCNAKMSDFFVEWVPREIICHKYGLPHTKQDYLHFLISLLSKVVLQGTI